MNASYGAQYTRAALKRDRVEVEYARWRRRRTIAVILVILLAVAASVSIYALWTGADAPLKDLGDHNQTTRAHLGRG